MSRRPNQTQNKSTADVGQVKTPELLGPDEAPAAPGMKKVTVQRTERFIESAPPRTSEPPPSPDDVVEGEDEWTDCPNCEGKFRVAAFDANSGYCPGCGRDEYGDRPNESESAPEVSEAEMLLASIADDDEYSLRVERLINYETDPRTDSQAPKEYCTTLKPVTLNYLETVRAGYGGGAFRFSMYKRGRPGIVKWWIDVIAKPNASPAVEAASQSAAAPPSAVQPTVDKLREAVERSVAKRIDDILDGNIGMAHQQTALTAPVDEQAIVAKAILSNPEVMTTMIRRVTDKIGGGEGEPWYAPIAREAVAHLPQILDGLQALAAQRNAAGQEAGTRGQEAGTTAQQPAPATQSTSPAPDSRLPTSSPAEIAFLRLLRRCAADMSSNTDANENQVDETLAVEETLRLVANFPEYRAQLDRVLSAPPGGLVYFVASQCQDSTLMRNPGAALFAADYQNSLRAALQELEAVAREQRQEENTVVHFPSLAPDAEAAS